MPTDPPTANPSAPPVPLGQAPPPQQQLAQHQRQQQIQYQRHRPPPPHAHQHQSPHLQHPQYPRAPTSQHQYAPLSAVRPIPQMQHQHHPSQPTPQQAQQQHVSQSIPRRDPVAHQPQQPFFPVNGYPMNTFAGRVAMDQYSVNGYIFPQPPYQYNPMQTPVAPQQATPVGPRGNRPYAQPMAPEIHSKPPSRVTVPAQRKNIIPILDPDTKEEIKVSASEPTNTPPPSTTSSNLVKIPQRTSRPLELVTDPADASQTGISNTSTNKSDHHVTSSSPAVGSSEKVNPIQPDVNEKSSLASNPVMKGNTLESTVHLSKPHLSQPTSGNTVQDINMSSKSSSVTTNMKKETARSIEVVSSDISSSTVADLPGENEDITPESDVTSVTESAAEVQSLPHITSDAPKKDSNTTTSQTPLTSTNKNTVEDNRAKSLQNNVPNISTKLTPLPKTAPVSVNKNEGINGDHKSAHVERSSTKSSLSENSRERSIDEGKSSEVPPSVPRRERPVFREGERRVYGSQFINEMRLLCFSPRSAEIEAMVRSAQIHKTDSAEQKHDRSGVRNTRPMPGESRGSRGFPGQSSGFQMVPPRVSTGVVGGGMGGHDAFDLRSARSQNPPPATRNQSSGRDGDPRGNRGQSGSRSRFDIHTRGGHGPIDAIVNPPEPVEKLAKSENAWKRNKDADDDVTAKVKQVRSLLNKLTLEKFEKIFKQIIDINLSSYDIVIGVVREIFEKTLFEPKFSEMYAELCSRLEKTLTPALQQAGITDEQGKPINFKRVLLNNCRDEFNMFRNPNADDSDNKSEKEDEESEQSKASDSEEKTKEQTKKEKVDEHEKTLNAFRAKRRMLANVRFIGELFLKDLIPERTIHRYCIQPLISRGLTTREEDVLEALCKLLSKTGAKLSTKPEAITHIDNYFQRLIALQQDSTLPARVRFMIQDLVEQRRDNWKLRREEAKAKTIAEIHKDIEKEERAKVEAQAAARERKNRGGNMHSRDRGPHSATPRIAMTMASRQRPTSTVSRSTAMLEKHASRGSTGISSNLQSKRLGPSGSKLGSGGAGGVGAASLRPGSRLNQFAALADRDSSGNAPSGDARRGKVPIVPSRGGRSNSRPESHESRIRVFEPEKLKVKARGIIEEYWSIAMMSEVKECLENEVPAPNYAAFVEECLRLAVDANKEKREKSVPFFAGLAGCNISRNDFIVAFKSIIGDLQDMTVDNPLAVEFVSKYIGAIIGTGKLGAPETNDFDLAFLTPLLSEMMNKRLASKVLLSLFSEAYKQFEQRIPDLTQRQEFIRRAYEAVNVDIAAYMSNYNRMRGIASLKDMIKERGLDFLFPLIDPELELKQILESDGNEEQVNPFLNSHKELVTGKHSERMVRMMLRETLDWLFGQSLDSFKDKFKSILCAPLSKCFADTIPKEVQMSAILEAQAYIVLNSDTLPPLGNGSHAHSPGSLVFEALYDGDLADEDSFMQWKEDTNRSMSIPGKQEMIIQTSKFFGWLENAEVGE